MKSVTSSKPARAFRFHGFDENPIQDVTVCNFDFNNVGQTSALPGIEDLWLINVKINGRPRQ